MRKSKWTGIETDKQRLREAYKPIDIDQLRSTECCVKVPSALPPTIAMTWELKFDKENT